MLFSSQQVFPLGPLLGASNLFCLSQLTPQHTNLLSSFANPTGRLVIALPRRRRVSRLLEKWKNWFVISDLTQSFRHFSASVQENITVSAQYFGLIIPSCLVEHLQPSYVCTSFPAFISTGGCKYLHSAKQVFCVSTRVSSSWAQCHGVRHTDNFHDNIHMPETQS